MDPALAIAADAPHLLLDTVDSTNLEAQRRADAGAPGPLWIEALEQTAGRGRRGRSWTGYPGNLFLTFLDRRPVAPRHAALLGFVGALAAADVAAAVIDPARVQVKWPNDGMIDGRKWCGVLLEAGMGRDGAPWRTLGIGLNLVGAPEETPYGATSLAAAGVTLARAAASLALRQRLAHWSGLLAQQGFGPVRVAWEARAFGLGRPVRTELLGAATEGTALGLAEDGALRLQLADGAERLITAGEVFFPASGPG